MPRQAHPVLSRRALNRATLARQLLLEPARNIRPVAALERIGGAQAQEPASPFIALWTRLADFDPSELHAAFRQRDAVKATLMRVTLHGVTADDYRATLPVVLPMFRAMGNVRRGTRRPAHVGEMARAAAEFAATPRRSFEVRDFVAAREAAAGAAPPAWWWIRRELPLVHVPEDVPWAFGRRPLLTTATAWFDDASLAEGGDVPLDQALRHVTRRYLAAFGPATDADLAAWSGVSATDFRPAIDALDAAGELVRFSDASGRTLFDVVDGERPDAEVPAPPRFLPMWDSVLLAFRDRTRIIADELRPRVIARNGDVLPTFLVDGTVAGFWWAVPDGGRTRIELEPFAPLDRASQRALAEEAERLAAFVGPREPAVYARYRASRARRH